MTKVLHITPHVGGGVGSVLHNYFQVAKGAGHDFSLLCLDKITTQQASRFSAVVEKVMSGMYDDFDTINDEIECSDIVVIHWWNHPLLFNLLVNSTLPPCRMALWSHVSGLAGTSIFTEALVNFPDEFVLTTPISKSLECTNIVNSVVNKATVIWSSAINHTSNQLIRRERNNDIRLLYVGTLDKAKISHDFLNLFEQLMSDPVTLTVVGGDFAELKVEAQKKGLSDKITFKGFVENAAHMMSSYDIFFYPLSSNHYGTCDQVIGEAMIAEMPVVAYDNPMEASIVCHDVTGYLTKSPQEFVRCTSRLVNNASLRKSLGNAARKSALDLYNPETMILKWAQVYSELMEKSKSIKAWPLPTLDKLNGLELFVESIGGDKYSKLLDLNETDEIWKELALNAAWMSNTKGSPFHYLTFFTTDIALAKACQILETIKGE